jgi:hypothetical protein
MPQQPSWRFCHECFEPPYIIRPADLGKLSADPVDNKLVNGEHARQQEGRRSPLKAISPTR